MNFDPLDGTQGEFEERYRRTEELAEKIDQLRNRGHISIRLKEFAEQFEIMDTSFDELHILIKHGYTSRESIYNAEVAKKAICGILAEPIAEGGRKVQSSGLVVFSGPISSPMAVVPEMMKPLLEYTFKHYEEEMKEINRKLAEAAA